MWYIIDDRGQYLTVGGLSSRNILFGWTSFATAEPFRASNEARDFGRWLGLPGGRVIDHHPHPEIPPDADTSRPETAEARAVRVQAEEAVRLRTRRAWSLK